MGLGDEAGHACPKFAFLILAHTDPVQFGRLVQSLSDPQFDLYVHVDLKSDLAEMQLEALKSRDARVFFLTDRQDVTWGGMAMVEATLGLYSVARSRGEYERFTLLSGLDFPLKSTAEMREIFRSCVSQELIMGNVLPAKARWRVTRFNFMEVGHRILRAVLRRTVGRIPRQRSTVNIDGRECPVWFAPQWSSLSLPCVDLVLDTVSRNPQILTFFKYSYAPDEMLVPTIVFNSAFAERALRRGFPPGAHYNDKCAIHYIDYEPVVRTLTERDFEALIASNKLFCRKVVSGESDMLLDMLRRELRLGYGKVG